MMHTLRGFGAAIVVLEVPALCGLGTAQPLLATASPRTPASAACLIRGIIRIIKPLARTEVGARSPACG